MCSAVCCVLSPRTGFVRKLLNSKRPPKSSRSVADQPVFGRAHSSSYMLKYATEAITNRLPFASSERMRRWLDEMWLCFRIIADSKPELR
jgi:hypothetical protein